jgi:hypothetical protein
VGEDVNLRTLLGFLECSPWRWRAPRKSNSPPLFPLTELRWKCT